MKLEILRAKKGDAFFLHYGTKEHPKMVIVDGGPSGVFPDSMQPRLEEIQENWISKKHDLHIELVMVSHIDDDHIRGIIDLFDHIRNQHGERFIIKNLWHNHFDDILGNSNAALLETSALKTLNLSPGINTSNLDHSRTSVLSKLVLTSVGQGRRLRDQARGLRIPANQQGDGLLMARLATEDPVRINADDGLTYRIISPQKKQLKDLQQKWDKVLKEKDWAEKVSAVEYLDKSIPNLSSIVALIEENDNSILFTGDARGDLILEDLRSGGYLDSDGKLKVDVFKLPHHGSSRNADMDLFETIIADYYVISGNGAHGNPDLGTFEMLFKARKDIDEPFTIYLTYNPADFIRYHDKDYPKQELMELINAVKKDLDFEVNWPPDGENSVYIEI